MNGAAARPEHVREQSLTPWPELDTPPQAGAARPQAGPHLIGYTDHFSVAPGEQLSFLVSASVQRACGTLVRLVHGDRKSPIGLVECEVGSSLDGPWRLQHQIVHPGSFGVLEPSARIAAVLQRAVSGHVFIYPTRLASSQTQGLLAWLDDGDGCVWELSIEPGGTLALRCFDGDRPCGQACLRHVVREHVWQAVSFTVDRERGVLDLWVRTIGSRAPLAHGHSTTRPGIPLVRWRSLLLAAQRLARRGGEPRATCTFNGKLERPILMAGALDARAVERLAEGGVPPATRALVDLDLGARPGTWELHDRVAMQSVGRLYNAPTRACTSHRWRGETTTPVLAPESYAAVHFHDDDVHHANWQPTRTWMVPADLASGVYALRLRADGLEDRIPFIVRPPRGRATHQAALWLPTFTYAAYANARECQAAPSEFADATEIAPGDRLLECHPEWGGATYDTHSDGSGVSFSGLGRPVPNLRPDHRVGLVNGPRHLAADLYLVHWLEHVGISVDIFGDEDVDAEGAALLSRYRTVLTGSHPEYVTRRELDAVAEYTEAGGRLMYMGGNGFYWVTAALREPAITVEVRRGHAGTRTWTGAPGEGHLQLTGEPGGLWRHRGRPPHGLVGVGFVAEGWDGHNRFYRRQADSFRPEMAWAFDGIGPDGEIGRGGLIMGGAAGDEIDSADPARGTPSQTLVLASSSGHSAAYWGVIEDVLESRDARNGTQDPQIHSDVTFLAGPAGGAVFAAGAISWVGSLSHDGYDNPAATLCANVLRTFISGQAPWLAGGDVLSSDTAPGSGGEDAAGPADTADLEVPSP